MTVFWILAAGLTGMALLFILPPLFRNHASDEHLDENQINLAVFKQQIEELDADLAAGNLEQSQYDSARRDLEKELLLDIDDQPADSGNDNGRSGRWAAGILTLAAPAVALAMYLSVGNRQIIDRLGPGQHQAQARAQAKQDAEDLPSMEVLVERLAQRMEENPGNVEGWVMLGRSYTSLGRHKDALKSYEKAKALAPEEPVVLLGYAEAVAKSTGTLEGEPAEVIAHVLELEPSNPNGLWMMGLLEFDRSNYAQAVANWQKLEAQLEPDSEDAAALRGYMAEARQQGNLPGAPAVMPPPAMTQVAEPATQPAAQPAGDGGKAVTVKVSLDPALQDKLDPSATLFVLARALQGPPMPLAIHRLTASDLPVEVTLDDSMAMMPQMKLSSFPQVRITARVSKTGQAKPESGDLEGEVKPVTPGQAEVVAVLIDSVRP